MKSPSERRMCHKNLITKVKLLREKHSRDTLTTALRMVKMAERVNLFNEYKSCLKIRIWKINFFDEKAFFKQK